MPQSELYKYKDEIDYLADYVGADVARDVVKNVVESIEDNVSIENSSGSVINPATENTVSSIDSKVATQSTLSSIAAALASNSNDTILIDATNALDVSASEVDVDLNSQSLTPITVTEDGPVDIADRDGRDLGDVQVKDTGPITDITSSTGSGNAAQLDLGRSRKDVDIFYDVSGAATVTIEVSKNASDWRAFSTDSPGSATTELVQIDTSYRYVRVYADSNLNTIELSSKGV